jgi:hypothetical protein
LGIDRFSDIRRVDLPTKSLGQAARHLNTLCGLTELRLTVGRWPQSTGKPLDDAGVRYSTDVRNEDVNALTSLTSLNELCFNYEPWFFTEEDSDLWLDAAATLPRLERLSLYECKVTQFGLAAIARMRKLRRLYLGGCEFEANNSLEVLQKMSGLRELDFAGMRIADEELVQLRASLPNCQIVRSQWGYH